MASKGRVRKAVIGDAAAVQGLVNEYARQGQMLGLSLAEIYEHVRDFFVFEREGQVTGTCALSIAWEDLAEIRSLAVRQDLTRRGIGRLLVEAAVREARGMGLKRIFALTYQGEFFGSLGFRRVEKSELPHKIWTDCIKCVKFPHCDEEAYLLDLEEERA